jgi:hypothetical protein
VVLPKSRASLENAAPHMGNFWIRVATTKTGTETLHEAAPANDIREMTTQLALIHRL